MIFCSNILSAGFLIMPGFKCIPSDFQRKVPYKTSMVLEVYPVSVSFDNRDPRRDRPFETRKPSEIETHGLVSKKHQGNYVPIECIYVKGTINIGISMYAVSKISISSETEGHETRRRSRYQSRSSRLGNLGRDRPLLKLDVKIL